ncbi:unnamed protein product, partial [marine sediment metagenome]
RRGLYTGLRKKPITMAGAFAVSAFGTPLISGAKYGVVRLAGAIPKLKKAAPLAKGVAWTSGITLAGAYGVSVGKRILLAPGRFEKGRVSGEIIATEGAPFVGGISAGKRLAFPIEYRVGFEKGLQALPLKR